MIKSKKAILNACIHILLQIFCTTNIFTDLLNMKSIYQFYEKYSTTAMPGPSHKFKAKPEERMFSILGCLFPWK